MLLVACSLGTAAVVSATVVSAAVLCSEELCSASDVAAGAAVVTADVSDVPGLLSSVFEAQAVRTSDRLSITDRSFLYDLIGFLSAVCSFFYEKWLLTHALGSKDILIQIGSRKQACIGDLNFLTLVSHDIKSRVSSQERKW